MVGQRLGLKMSHGVYFEIDTILGFFGLSSIDDV